MVSLVNWEKYSGLPSVIPEVADTLFGFCDAAEAEYFSRQIIDALLVVDSTQGCAYFGSFIHHWCHWLIMDPDYGVLRFNPDGRIRAIALLHEESTFRDVSIEEWEEAEASVAEACDSAYAAVNHAEGSKGGKAEVYAAVASETAFLAAMYAARAVIFDDDAAAADVSGAAFRAATSAAARAAVEAGIDVGAAVASVDAAVRIAQREKFVKILNWLWHIYGRHN